MLDAINGRLRATNSLSQAGFSPTGIQQTGNSEGWRHAQHPIHNRISGQYAMVLARQHARRDHRRMDRLAENLRKLLKDSELSENALSEKTGVPQPTINRILKRQSRDPRDSTLLPLAKFFRLSVEELRRGNPDGVHPLVASSENREGYVRFPLLEGYAGMGQGDYMPDLPEVVEFVEVARVWAEWKLRGIPLDQVRVITGRGDSMRGEFEHGDLIFVDARVKRFLADSAYVFRWHGRVQVKRLQQVGNGLVRILSHNPAYPPIDVPVDELEIGGRALAAWTLREF